MNAETVPVVSAEEAHELTEIIAQAIRARYETGATEKA